MTEDQADTWALQLGLAPEQVWPEYMDLWGQPCQ